METTKLYLVMQPFTWTVYSKGLILSTGQKYECARKWNVHCVSIQWFFDSIEKSFCQDESMYKTEPVPSEKILPETSTPTGNSNKPDSKYTLDKYLQVYFKTQSTPLSSCTDL